MAIRAQRAAHSDPQYPGLPGRSSLYTGDEYRRLFGYGDVLAQEAATGTRGKGRCPSCGDERSLCDCGTG